MAKGELTRRSLLARSFAGAGVLLAPAAARALASPPDGEVFAMDLPRGSLASASRHGGWLTTTPLTAPKRFDLLGVELANGRAARIELRVRTSRGRWSAWVAVPSGDGHGPESGAAGRVVTDPVWAGGSDLFQLRSSRPLGRVRVHFVNATGTATARDRARTAVRRLAAARTTLATPRLAAGPGQPPIIARSSWATAACRPRQAPYYGSVDVAFVHHTVSANSYSPSQSAAMVRSICLFHRNVNRWNDIGYNFVVDRYGQIFEGRQGGIDEALSGAHAGGYNLSSTGVAMLGTYAYSPPGSAALSALTRLLAWKLSLHGVDASGRTTVVVSKYGSAYSRYRAGTAVPLHRIAGHRDGDTTECPGNAMYRRLPKLRAAVRQLQGAIGALTAQPTAPSFTFPNPAMLSGALTSDGQPVPGAQIEVQQLTSTGEQTLATTTTNPDGTWSAGAQLPRNATLRALFRGGAGVSAIVSPAVGVLIAPQVTLSSATAQAAAGMTIDFTGTTTPAKKQVALVISQLQPDGVTYAEARRIAVDANPDGTFSRTVAFTTVGQYQVTAVTAPDDLNAGGASPPLSITIA